MNLSEDEAGVTDDLVMTPGGLKPRSHVHPVRPSEAVQSNADGTFSIVPRELANSTERDPEMATELVLTPGGFRPKSRVHFVPPSHVIDGSQNRMRIMHPSGALMADYGAVTQRQANRPHLPDNIFAPSSLDAAAFPQGWVAYTEWNNSGGSPVSSFSTTWVVPPVPATSSGQVVFLFNGLQNSDMIYQPVLQWGPSQAGGGSFWAVASWYANGQTGHSFHSTLVPVNPGQVLVGVMTLTGNSAAGFSYNCGFTGIANTSLPITNVPVLFDVVETLETYGVTQCSDLPATDKTAFTAINLQTSAGIPPLVWTVRGQANPCNTRAVVVNGAPAGGEVDILYH